MTVTYRSISFRPSSNNTPLSQPYCVFVKENCTWIKSNRELRVGIGDDSYYSPLVIDDDLNMGDTSGGNVSLNNHTISKKYCNTNNGDVRSGYGFSNSHTLFQYKDSSTFKNNAVDVQEGGGGVSSGYGFKYPHLIQI